MVISKCNFKRVISKVITPTEDKSFVLVPLRELVFNSKSIRLGYAVKTCWTATCSKFSFNCSIAAIAPPIANSPAAAAAAPSALWADKFLGIRKLKIIKVLLQKTILNLKKKKII